MIYSDLLKTIHTCPFCGTEKEMLLENEHAYLTYAIAPYHQDHLLVIPKEHFEHILDLDETHLLSIDRLQKKAIEILHKLGHTNISILVKEGDAHEKTIAHTHYHIIPDVLLESSDHSGAKRNVLSKDEITGVVSRIKSVLN